MNTESKSLDKRKQLLEEVIKHVNPVADEEYSKLKNRKYEPYELSNLRSTINFYFLKSKNNMIRFESLTSYLSLKTKFSKYSS